MIWYWGRWYFPFLRGGCLALPINIILAVLYLAMCVIIILLVVAAVVMLAALFPCWILFLL